MKLREKGLNNFEVFGENVLVQGVACLALSWLSNHQLATIEVLNRIQQLLG